MPPPPRRDFRLRRCKCDDCCSTNPVGIDQNFDTLRSHSKKQQIRDRFKTLLTSTSASSVAPPTLSSSETGEASMSSASSHHAASPSSTPFNEVPSATSQNVENLDDRLSHSAVSADPDSWLGEIKQEIDIRLNYLQDTNIHLNFDQIPSPNRSFIIPDPEMITQVNSGPFALTVSHPSNRRFLETEARFCTLLRDLQIDPRHHGQDSERDLRDISEDLLYSALETLHRMKRQDWERQASPDSSNQYIFNNAQSFRVWAHQDPTVRVTLITALICHIKFRTTIRQMKVVLALQRAMIRSLTRRVKPEIRTAFGLGIADQIPKDIHTVVGYYDLDPSCSTFVSCSSCHALYPLTEDDLIGNENAYAANQCLSSCSSKTHPDSPECGNALWKPRSVGSRMVIVPVQKQTFQNLREWIGKLLAIPGIEDSLEECLNRNHTPTLGPAQDFWDSPIFRDFAGPDGMPFMRQRTDISGSTELRLLMSLGYDSFNPFHMKRSGGSASSTALYMVLLVLPEHLRYRKEYMFLVTVMRGHPTEAQVNHSLQKIVDQLLLFWNGIFFTRTSKYPKGRTVYAALAPAVCDTEGAHSLSGFASHSHKYFCVRCVLPIQDIHNLDPDTWPKRNLETHKIQAALWRDAPSQTARRKIYDDYGMRWSELLRLPYWNPITYTIIDSMHLSYLGLFATHVRKIWKLNAEVLESGEGYAQAVFDKKRKKPSNSLLRELYNSIRENQSSLKKTLNDQTQAVLWYICFDLALPSAGKKESLVNAILTWRETVALDAIPIIPPLSFDMNVVDTNNNESQEVFGALDSDIESVSSLNSTSTRSSVVFDVEEARRHLPLASHSTCPDTSQGGLETHPQYQNLIEQLQNKAQKMPGLSRIKKDMLKALCSGLGIYYNDKEDHNNHLVMRLKIYHAEQVEDWEEEPIAPNTNSLHFLKLKERFEEKEPTMATLMGSEYSKDYLAQLCTTSRHVIAKDILDEVWKDMKITILPSWIDSPPENWGTKATGKLSADEWKVVCSVSLVITLIRLWGYKYEKQPQARQFQMLQNFLDMVHAIRLLNLRETSPDSREEYLSMILKYLRGVLVLFPDVTLKPNHHYAVHILEDLKLMGPVQARNTPIFERTNHILQEVNSNNHSGEVEATMQNDFGRQGRLEIILEHSPELRSDISEALDALLEMKRESHRGMFDGTDLSTWSSSDRTFKSWDIVIDNSTLNWILDLLCAKYSLQHSAWDGQLVRNAVKLAGIVSDGVVFSCNTRESSVVFKDSETGKYGAGIIQRIISYSYPHPMTGDSETAAYLEVLHMNPIEANQDLYRRLNCGWLCSRNLARYRLLPLSEVVSHFARTELTINDMLVTHVLPTPKVQDVIDIAGSSPRLTDIVQSYHPDLFNNCL
ncbi:hypothetical protein F5878DRAFT_662668 [Lentinula raphanica]|uniref:Transposase family Tnp2 protein n=1 Tax=Lentinula raphanica TaxID=153919 RepID=A0AA38UC22_9AGAR|nr:hypothetical protein F5878DRAFT_662668 [Lentinula raphanica]